jgi:hypothetical protein
MPLTKPLFAANSSSFAWLPISGRKSPMHLLNSTLTIYNWGVVCFLLGFLFLVAHFYEKKSGRKSYYLFFLIPTFLFALAAVSYSLTPSLIVGQVLADLSRLGGGIVLVFLGFWLLRLMTGGRT